MGYDKYPQSHRAPDQRKGECEREEGSRKSSEQCRIMMGHVMQGGRKGGCIVFSTRVHVRNN